MGSVLALVDAKTFKPHAKGAALGAVLPIDRFLTTDTSFATELSHGGALYLVSSGPNGELWLVAVLEAPECAGVKIGDKRAAGWYAATNAMPVTDISTLRKRLKLGKDLEDALDEPRILAVTHERVLRELLDVVDAPVIAPVAIATESAPELDPNLPILERASVHLQGGHIAAAIDMLIAAWRQTRAPGLADLVDRATRLLPNAELPMFDKRERWNGEREAGKHWEAVLEADPKGALPQLLLHIPLVRSDHVIEKLGKLPEDPRIGARFVELIGSAPFFPGSQYWSPRLDLWIRSKDVRTIDTLLGIPDLTGPKADKYRAWATTAKVPTLSETDALHLPAIERALERLEEPLRTEGALIDEIAQTGIADDGPFLVYADWLIERGRPLGEFIMLACAEKRGALTPAQARRLATLVEVPYLCGAFDDFPLTRVRKRDRGIDRDISMSTNVTPRGWQRLGQLPLTRALTEIRLIGSPREGRAAAIAAFVQVAPRLERIENLGRTTVNQIVKLLPQQAAVSGDDLVLVAPKKATRGGPRR